MLMLSKMHALAVGTRTSLFPAVRFPGSGTNTRGGGLTGAAYSSQGIFHCFFKTSNSGNNYFLQTSNSTVTVLIRIVSTNVLFEVANTTRSKILKSQSSLNIADGNWHSLLMSWDTNFSTGNKLLHTYLDDSAATFTPSDDYASFNVDYTTSEWYVMGSGGNAFNGDISQFYFATGRYLDFSVVANRRKFVAADNLPVSLGANGSLPTGSAPIIFLNNPAASYGTNLGTGGNFTIGAAISDVEGPA